MSAPTIAAIPTMYRGRQYRSRLEARWAAFFDLLGWRHEYEPFDLGTWSPDFAIREIDPLCGQPVLAEVKPLDAFDHQVAKRMVAGIERCGVDINTLLLTRTAPVPIELGHGQYNHSRAVLIGWIGDLGVDDKPMTADWRGAVIAFVMAQDQPRLMADILCLAVDEPGRRPSWESILTGQWGYSNSDRALIYPGFYPDHVLGLWAQATNHVQWLGKSAQL